ncbi:hypothetical protein JYU34_019380 [Plutella xylostella]|uniref:Uncharacterized protein n=1 Tax=Plutella xylostella TaxID=51655 RepID=A0ABQ7PWX3_PLUXY|nr:hypothetical protein JYU34_019380 [Plutella xylostella]
MMTCWLMMITRMKTSRPWRTRATTAAGTWVTRTWTCPRNWRQCARTSTATRAQNTSWRRRAAPPWLSPTS